MGSRKKIKKENPFDGVHHIDTSILIEHLFNQENYEKATKLIRESIYNKKPRLGISVLSLGESIKAIAESDYSSEIKQNAVLSLLHWLKEGAVIYHSDEKIHKTIEKIQEIDYRIKHPDALILATAICKGGKRLSFFDGDFDSRDIISYCKEKGLKLVNLRTSN